MEEEDEEAGAEGFLRIRYEGTIFFCSNFFPSATRASRMSGEYLRSDRRSALAPFSSMIETLSKSENKREQKLT